MHLDDRWLSGGGERRHVSKADPWLDDGLGTIAPMFCPPLSIKNMQNMYLQIQIQIQANTITNRWTG